MSRVGLIHRVENKVENQVENKVENQVENKVEKRPPNKPPTKASGLRPEPNPQTGQHRRLSESCLSVIVDRTFCTAPIEDFGIIVIMAIVVIHIVIAIQHVIDTVANTPNLDSHHSHPLTITGVVILVAIKSSSSYIDDKSASSAPSLNHLIAITSPS